jgi:hypothetical protein
MGSSCSTRTVGGAPVAGESLMAQRLSNVDVRDMNAHETASLIDGLVAQHYLGISGAEFQRAWAGEFDDDSDRPEVMRIGLLMPHHGRH